MNPEIRAGQREIITPQDGQFATRFNAPLRDPLKSEVDQMMHWMTAEPRKAQDVEDRVEGFFTGLNGKLSEPSALLTSSLSPDVSSGTIALAETIAGISIARIANEKPPESSSDFEPFVRQEEPDKFWPPPRHRFVNNYGGPYATKLELNRSAAEKFIKLSRLEGNITLSQLPYSRGRAYMEINPDATVSAKRGLTADQRKLDEEGNPYYRVNATGDGWTVQINGQQILQDIQDKPSKKVADEARFAREFNRYLRRALKDCVDGEKLTPAKDMFFYDKLFGTLMQPALAATFSGVMHHDNLRDFISDLAFRMLVAVPIAYGLVDFMKRKTNPAYFETNPRRGVEIVLPL